MLVGHLSSSSELLKLEGVLVVPIGAAVGLTVGIGVGIAEGLSVGDIVGEDEGAAVGALVGRTVPSLLVGHGVGAAVGVAVGDAVGAEVGQLVLGSNATISIFLSKSLSSAARVKPATFSRNVEESLMENASAT